MRGAPPTIGPGPSAPAAPLALRAPAALVRAREAVARCELCPRLRSHCRRVATEKKAAHRDDVYWGRPVPGFGDPRARLLVVGLAPAAHGANRTGRVFTGDGSGDFLMRAMHAQGFASIPTARHVGDGLALRDAYILSVVRCAPPDNRPLPEEIARCRVHLGAELAALPDIRVVVALGKIGFDGYLAYLASLGRMTSTGASGHRARPRPAFAHGVAVALGPGLPLLLGSYHPSRQNTNTGRLTPPMLEAVFREARRHLDESQAQGGPR